MPLSSVAKQPAVVAQPIGILRWRKLLPGYRPDPRHGRRKEYWPESMSRAVTFPVV